MTQQNHNSTLHFKLYWFLIPPAVVFLPHITCTVEICTDLVLKAMTASLTSSLMVQLCPACHGSAIPTSPAGLDQVLIKWCGFSINSKKCSLSPKKLNWKSSVASRRLPPLPGFEVKSQQEGWKLLWLAKLSAKSWLATGERLGWMIQGESPGHQLRKDQGVRKASWKKTVWSLSFLIFCTATT